MYKKIKRWYMQGLWTKTQVDTAHSKGFLTDEQYEDIINSNVV